MRVLTTFVAAWCLVLFIGVPSAPGAESEAAKMGPPKPEAWWPVEPRPLPFMHPPFSDHMVLQREVAAPVWGWSTPGDVVVVFLDGKPVGAAATAGADGRWMTRVGPLPAGGPHSLSIRGKSETVEPADILVGDVWLCSASRI
jgi:hypothetical protein